MIRRLLRILKRTSFCICKDKTAPGRPYLFESAPLEGGRTTSFTMMKCRACRGWYGFSNFNFKIAILYETLELHKIFKEIGLDLSSSDNAILKVRRKPC